MLIFNKSYFFILIQIFILSTNCITLKPEMENAIAMDRGDSVTTIDITYRLHLPSNHSNNYNYNQLMLFFHGMNIWEDQKLINFLYKQKIEPDSLYGSPINDFDFLKKIIINQKTKIFVEIGVFRGATSIGIAKMLDELISNQYSYLHDSFIISIDTWLLDLRFVWEEYGQTKNEYFKNKYIGGNSLMYYTFLSNVIKYNVTHRIIPMPSSSLNAAMSFIAHGIKPDFIYLDASHANPDVYLDLINWWNLLNNNGIMVCDDYGIPSVRQAIDTVVKIYDIKNYVKGGQIWFFKK